MSSCWWWSGATAGGLIGWFRHISLGTFLAGAVQEQCLLNMNNLRGRNTTIHMYPHKPKPNVNTKPAVSQPVTTEIAKSIHDARWKLPGWSFQMEASNCQPSHCLACHRNSIPAPQPNTEETQTESAEHWPNRSRLRKPGTLKAKRGFRNGSEPTSENTQALLNIKKVFRDKEMVRVY